MIQTVGNLIMKHVILIAFLMFITIPLAHSKEYGQYDLKLVRTIVKSKSGNRYGIDLKYLDPILYDLGLRAKNSPAQFSSAQEQERAVRDINAISGMLDVLVNQPKADPGLLVRAGFINTLGRNIGIPGSSKKAHENFKKLLKAKPADPQGNYLYGTFLAGEGKVKKAIPHLEKALSGGIPDAAFTLGMAYRSLGNKQKALDNFEIFKKSSPFYDESVDGIIEELRKDKAKNTKRVK